MPPTLERDTRPKRATAMPAPSFAARVFAFLANFAQTLAQAGTHGYPPDVRRRLVVMNLIAYLIAVTTLGFAIQHAQLDFAKYSHVIYINLALVFTAVAVPFSHRINDLAGGLVIVVSEYVALLAFTAYLGRDAGVQSQYFIAAAAAFVVFGVERWRLIVPLVIISIGLHLTAWHAFPGEAALIDAEPEVLNNIYTQAAITTGALIAASVYYAFSLAESAKAETDALLRNILPDKIVERLKASPGEAIADTIEDASVLFADISGFVALARQLGAQKVVELLNRIVSEFDEIAERHGVEKIKTIGDAYMAASGVPEPSPGRQSEHTASLVRFGLEMLEAVDRISAETGIDLRVRIGIASGPVMAGVIGQKKFSYDIWGDAVNLAARLENQSAPGRILICPTCRDKLEGAFAFEPRGVIEIKGVGPQETWFVTGELVQPIH